MTNQLQKKTTLKQRPPIPSRDEFHRDFAGLIYAADFNTYYPNPYRNIGNTSAYGFTVTNIAHTQPETTADKKRRIL